MKKENIEKSPLTKSDLDQSLNVLSNDIRAEIKASNTFLGTELRSEMHSIKTELQSEIRTSKDELRSELLCKIDESEKETRRFMGVLHEDTLHKLDLVLEGYDPLTRKTDRHDRQIEKLENRVSIVEFAVTHRK